MADNIDFNLKLYQEALAGTLATTNPSEQQHSLGLQNRLYIPVCYTTLDANGLQGPTHTLNHDEHSDSQNQKAPLHTYILLTNGLSGAFIAVYKLKANTQYMVGQSKHYDFLFKPNTIGLPPAASTEQIIPSNSWPIVVGISDKQKGDGNQRYVVVREQSWSMSGTSYALAPGETKQISVTHEFGREDTTSDDTTVATSLNVSASGGWGPISASVAASLSVTSAYSHTVAIRESDTTYQVDTLKNTTDASLIVFFWKLMDTVTVYGLTNDTASTILSSVTSPVGPMVPMAYTFDGTQLKLADAAQLRLGNHGPNA